MVVKEFRLPDVGEGVAEGELVTWLVEPGDRVEEDQPVAEVETDKALVEVPSRYDGVVEALFVEEGEIVPVGDVIISFRVDEADGGSGEPVADETPEDPTDGEDDRPAPRARSFAPPSVRRLARELDVDLGAVQGSGPGGRVTEGDVRAHADAAPDTDRSRKQAVTARKTDDAHGTHATSDRTEGANDGRVEEKPVDPAIETAGRERTLATPATRNVARELGVDIDDVPTDVTRDGEAFVDEAAVRAYAEARTGPSGDTTGEPPEPGDRPGPDTVPYRGVRRTIGERMERSVYTAPHVTHHDTAEVDALVTAREELASKAESAGVRLTYMPFVLKAVVAGLKSHPYLNSELREDDEEIVLKREYNIGIAVATDAGLMVPVVNNVDGKGLFELAAEVADLAARARERSITPDEMRGGTFTITNFGAIGGEYATPIINYPETAILGLGAIEDRPVVRSSSDCDADESGERAGSTVVPAATLPLSLSIDHRVVDGAVAASFANTVMEHLENPLLLISE